MASISIAKVPKFFTEDDVRILQRMIDRERRQIINAPPMRETGYWDHGEDQQASEVYVALPQTSAGIPASDTTYATGDEPGAADCDIYEILIESDIPRLRPVTGLSHKVYNVGEAIDQVWIPVARDKYGKWLAMVGSGGSGLEIVRFEIKVADCTTGCAMGEVLAIHCGGSQLVGEEIDLHDAAGCFLTGNEAGLVGLQGYAVKMAGDDPCPGTGTWPGAGTTTSTEAGCVWEIISLCCITESCG